MEAEKKISDQKEKERIAREHMERLCYAVKNSPLLQRLNGYLLKSLIYAWKQEAEARIQPAKEHIKIEFKSLELSSSIIQPTIKIEVAVCMFILVIISLGWEKLS